MIRFEQVSVSYAPELPNVLHNATFEIPEGELCLVVGETGSGKSTLLGAVNGLVPHFTGGILTGRVLVDGRDTRDHPPRELADVVGVVGQDPYAGFVTDTVADELAYTMESLAIPFDSMRRRIEDVLDVLSLAPLRNRSLSSLSGGQAQRVAIGSVLTAHPKILVLDEPTSALDPASAEEVLAVLQRLVHDNNLTVLLAEHRLERVVQYADSVIWVPSDGGPPLHASPADIMAVAPVYPPVVRLGRSQGWSPLPLSVRDARRLAGELRDRLPAQPAHSRPPASAPKPLATVTGLDVSYGRRLALDGVDLTLHAGEIVALMGRNGAGKSTLFATLSGSIRPAAGQVRLLGPNTDATGVAPHQLRPRALIDLIALVPQQPGDLLYGDDVADECRIADRDSSVPPGTCAELLAGIAGDLDLGRHPRDLSEGERLALALAVVLTARPALIALDEPTRGLDYVAKARLVAILRRLAGDGQGIVLATHDTELAAEVADRVVVLADGAVVTDGPVREVLTQSPVFAPQIAKVLSPLPYLTVSDVTIGLVLNR